MSDTIEKFVQLILNNITWVIFGLFMLSGVIGKSGGNKPTSTDAQPQKQPHHAAGTPDNRPLAERMAEHFGIDLDELQGKPTAQPQTRSGKYASEGRRSTTTGNVQDNYPELFGGPGLFAERKSDTFNKGETKFGFDETEWGSTFEKNEQQWGGGFPDRKSSEPRIEWPR